MQLTSQAPDHVEITKVLSTSQCKFRITDCQYLSWNMLRPRRIKLTVTKYGFLHIYKLTTYLVTLAKSLPLQ